MLFHLGVLPTPPEDPRRRRGLSGHYSGVPDRLRQVFLDYCAQAAATRAPATIKATLQNGRQAAMPAWGSIIGDKGVADVVQYVLSLNGRDTDAGQVAAGETVFKTYCVACHGPDGHGNTAFGARNLTNGVWLYGGSKEQLTQTIRAGRNGVMPAFKDSLSEDKIHILTAYVYGLSRK